ncbi:acyl carrier protein [Teredinibacter sp. KSP-S5-2]|uniref:acyl carrier protein n=1 Tax=Teredinibacter sp. KSP-S5-2 TaxID=3034506 RepID=UPI0029343E11|nr:acyl carrier protein [Teredinibacter sp. KSP-S5-2]WNO11324.1 acyl carrier protein [Teredinibacter sp. KSP-S5-2]
MTELENKVLEIIRNNQEFVGSNINLETKFREDLGVDSLVIAQLAIEIEDAFDIRFEGIHMSDLTTIRQVIIKTEELIERNSKVQ